MNAKMKCVCKYLAIGAAAMLVVASREKQEATRTGSEHFADCSEECLKKAFAGVSSAFSSASQASFKKPEAKAEETEERVREATMELIDEAARKAADGNKYAEAAQKMRRLGTSDAVALKFLETLLLNIPFVNEDVSKLIKELREKYFASFEWDTWSRVKKDFDERFNLFAKVKAKEIWEASANKQ